MAPEILFALSDFFSTVERLRQFGVIRSDKYLGDIGEFIAKNFYDIELSASGRQPGYDAFGERGRVQIKYHGSRTRTNVDLGNPAEYEVLVVVLGPSSMLRPTGYQEEFLVYEMPSNEVREYQNIDRHTYSCGKAPFNRTPDRRLSLQPVHPG